jgi:hypothetical protein
VQREKHKTDFSLIHLLVGDDIDGVLWGSLIDTLAHLREGDVYIVRKSERDHESAE